MTPTQLTTFWDNLMTELAAKLAKRPVVHGFLVTVKGIGDQMIPTLAASIPAGLSPAALVDALFAALEAKVTAAWEKTALQVVNQIVDAYLGTLTLPPVPAA